MAKGAEIAPPCLIPEALQNKIPHFKTGDTDSVLTGILKLNRYVYMGPARCWKLSGRGTCLYPLKIPISFIVGLTWPLIGKDFPDPIRYHGRSGLVDVACSFLFLELLRPYLSMLIGMKKKEAVADLALQVAHDIRSPSAALNSMVKEL